MLNDPEKRSKYDQYGEHWKNVGNGFGAGAQGGGEGGFEGFDFSQFGTGGGFSDFFSQMFGGGTRAGGAHRSRSYHSGFNPFNEATAQYADRECKVNIDMYTALLGGDIVIQTPSSDRLKLKIKAGTQPGTKVRLKGKGDVNPDGSRGNLILTYNVTLPTTLTDKQKELLVEMRNAQ